MIFSNEDKEKGQTLVEAVVAVTIVTMIIVSLVSAVTVAVSSATFSKNKSLATKYVSQGMEGVRSIRDRSWDELIAGSLPNPGKKNGIQNTSGQWEFSGSSDTPATGFTREVTVINLDPLPGSQDEVKVIVEVSWFQGTKTFKSEATTNLTIWK